MKIVTIIENDPITGVRYGVAEVPEYNNNVKRRLERHFNLRNKVALLKARANNTKQK